MLLLHNDAFLLDLVCSLRAAHFSPAKVPPAFATLSAASRRRD